MESVKPKRFSFSGFSSSLSRSFSFSSNEQQKQDESHNKSSKRAQKSKSLYIKSFRKPEERIKTSYDAKEATQSNGKEIRNNIRRSLSAVLYASPQSKDKTGENSNKLVPVLVTPELSESVGGILIDDSSSKKLQEEIKKTERKKAVEYDNTLDVFVDDTTNDTITILWQGYCYTIKISDKNPVASEIIKQENAEMNDIVKDLKARYERELWYTYHGLIHPLHLFKEKDDNQEILDTGKWHGLSVGELKRYYDNYGSMMLKIRESRMLEQQRHYYCLSDAKKEWIIPEIVKEPQQVISKV
ncbi:hypothetical protein G6F70_006458 [Rhizopus microsporus]|uniref:Uncharacterized protein n=2 Tax=Rhizopus TaxID=4842 RepID=A0A367K0T0_RHIAZ|nr:hypothetical protein G6F71_007611 [Rhizopus microsporus]RCH95778.1 hypothetical protein CU097_012863 [Rhizopus azygosporus]KAG1197628.1 hypothetical protein G6F70_006458 [Rhizopus microsporus]KAG1209396.1 hypothetical protein G6F69_006389 [Rhizopus microsporus]KAG1230941.1 hypothetical protein G6F67_006108 [Rhizopus microsporus]